MEVVSTNPNPDSRTNDPAKSNRKRKPKRASNGAKLAKRMKSMPKYQGSRKKPRDSKKERRLIRKRDREYNSDDDEGDEEEEADRNGSEDEEEEQGSEGWNDEDRSREGSGDEDGDEVMPKGITKFTEGCRAFKMAFKKIMKKSESSDALGPVLSAYKKLVVNKLAEEAAELKVKGEARKKKLLIEEKGHAQPANFLDSKEKFLISIATKGDLQDTASTEGFQSYKVKRCKSTCKTDKEATNTS